MTTLDRTRRLTRRQSRPDVTLTTVAGARQQRVVCVNENENENENKCCRKTVIKSTGGIKQASK